MALGNDIVDLSVAKKQKRTFSPRFLNKVFTKNEQSYLWEAEDPFTRLWLLWSIKESTYKCHLKNCGTRLFNPVKINCIPQNENCFSAVIDHRTYHTFSTSSTDFIHTIATEDSDFPTVHYFRTNGLLEETRKIVYSELITEISQLFDVKPSRLQISKDKTGIPQVHLNGRPLPLSISISHHGKYGAFVYRPI